MRGEFDPRAERQHSETAQRGGRHFNTITDFLGWPETEVRRHLKSRSRVLAVVDRRDIPADAPRRVIFRRGMPDQDVRF